MSDESSNVTSTWPMSATTKQLQAEMDAVMREALAGRMPATRLRFAERVVEAARSIDRRDPGPGCYRRLRDALAAYDLHATPQPRMLTAEEGRALIDERARRFLGMSGAEFRRRYEAGEFDADADDNVLRLAMLLPLGYDQPGSGSP